MLNKNLVIVGASAVAGGIPEDVQKLGIQLGAAVVAWLGTVALDWLRRKLQSGKKSKNSTL